MLPSIVNVAQEYGLRYDPKTLTKKKYASNVLFAIAEVANTICHLTKKLTFLSVGNVVKVEEC